MTNLADFLLGHATNVEQVKHTIEAPPSKAPKGWEPGVVWTGSEGVGVSKPQNYSGSEVDHEQLLQEWGFDPAMYEIAGALDYSQWDANIGGCIEVMRSYKARIIRRPDSQDMESLPDLIKRVRSHKKLAKKAPTGDHAFVVCLGDWQIGKTDIGGTSSDTTDKILTMIDQVEERVKELRKAGRPLGELYVLGLGDMIERCSGFYANQEFVTDLTEEEQKELAVELILKALERWSGLFENVVVAAVVGNHGENRKNGKPNTDRVRDNADTAVFKTVATVFRHNPERYGHISFVFPEDRSTLRLNVAGVTVGIAHGNQYSSAANAFKNWWQGQTLGYQPLADAHIVVTGHYHHLKVNQYGPRTHIQIPAMDPGSLWFSEGTGLESPSGTVTFVVDGKSWADLAVL